MTCGFPASDGLAARPLHTAIPPDAPPALTREWHGLPVVPRSVGHARGTAVGSAGSRENLDRKGAIVIVTVLGDVSERFQHRQDR